MNVLFRMCDHETKELEDGQYVCTTCGTILHCFIDDGPEWRYYGADDKNEDPSRSGAATHALLTGTSYGSVAMHRKGTSPGFRNIERLSAWSFAVNSERSWLTALDVLQSYSVRNGISRAILMDSCQLFRSQEDALKLRGETRRALMGACLFTSCRRNGVSRTHEEVSKIVNVSTRSLCKAIVRFDDSVTLEHPIMLTQLSLAERMMNGLELNEVQRDSILTKIRSIFKSVDEELEHTPKVIVAGVIASILMPSKSALKEFAKHSGVSAVSIQKVMGKL